MAFQPRGGPAQVLRVSAAVPTDPAAPTDAEVAAGVFSFAAVTTRVRIKTATNPVKVFFREEDFRKGANYALVSTTEVLSEPVETRSLWLMGSGGTASVELLAILKG